MSVLTPSAAKGQPFFEGSSSMRTHDDSSDNFVAGVYTHNPLEGSATEADEWNSIFMFLFGVARAGGGAILVRNASGGTLHNGPVQVSGYYGDDANGFPIFKITAADANGNGFANALLLTDLADATTGTAYFGGDFTPSVALDTSAAAQGDSVYVAAGGGMTLTPPTGSDQYVQEIGRVKTVNLTGVVAGFVKPPKKFGKSFLQGATDTVLPITVATVLTADQTGSTITNEGAAGAPAGRAITLPTAAAGLRFRFYDQAGLLIKIIASAGDTIRIGRDVTVAGNIVNGYIGQMVELIAINATEWVATTEVMGWTVT